LCHDTYRSSALVHLLLERVEVVDEHSDNEVESEQCPDNDEGNKEPGGMERVFKAGLLARLYMQVIALNLQ
jgi:hypothetical protein